jgi:hypothetical protein
MKPAVAMTLGVLALTLPGCGGSAPGTPDPAPPTTAATAPPPTTTLATAGDPELKLTVTTRAGMQPLDVNFSACGSRDGTGGTDLRYLVDYDDGKGLREAQGCGFSHRFGSDGVTIYETNICVENKSGAGTRKCADPPVIIKTYVDVSVAVNKNTGCAGTVVASARLKLGHNSVDASASSQVDRVEFEAFNAAGRSIASRNGQQRNPTEWLSGTWNVNDTTKLRVRATVFSRNVRGDDIPEDTRPEC